MRSNLRFIIRSTLGLFLVAKRRKHRKSLNMHKWSCFGKPEPKYGLRAEKHVEWTTPEFIADTRSLRSRIPSRCNIGPGFAATCGAGRAPGCSTFFGFGFALGPRGSARRACSSRARPNVTPTGNSGAKRPRVYCEFVGEAAARLPGIRICTCGGEGWQGRRGENTGNPEIYMKYACNGPKINLNTVKTCPLVPRAVPTLDSTSGDHYY